MLCSYRIIGADRVRGGLSPHPNPLLRRGRRWQPAGDDLRGRGAAHVRAQGGARGRGGRGALLLRHVRHLLHRHRRPVAHV